MLTTSDSIFDSELSKKNRELLVKVGFTKMPVTWSDNKQQDYLVYLKGHLEMGGFVNLMERIEYIGKKVIYR